MKVPAKPPAFSELMAEAAKPGQMDDWLKVLGAGIRATVAGRYRHFANLKHLEPPEGLTQRQWWFGIKAARAKLSKPLPLYDKAGLAFTFVMPDEAWAMVHEVDRNASGSIAASEQVANPDSRDRYIVSSLIEEAITSSQLEGAATTTPIAKEMLRSGRRPRDENEQMIVNNYLAMQAIRKIVKEPLTPKRVLEIHRVMTAGTLTPGDAAGRLRTDGEYRIVVDQVDGVVLHEPPVAKELPRRLDALCDFANASAGAEFLHPVVRAILLHFWLAYDHPFVDGNGRTARALFYWSMLSSGYWLCEFISISSVIKKASAKYARAFLYTETDENDTTYFILHQLRVTIQAISQLHAYLKKKAAEIRNTERLLRRSSEFNHRQLALLGHALRHPGMQYTVKAHQVSHNVVYETARSDLLGLTEKDLLIAGKRGRAYLFAVPQDLSKRLENYGQR